MTQCSSLIGRSLYDPRTPWDAASRRESAQSEGGTAGAGSVNTADTELDVRAA